MPLKSKAQQRFMFAAESRGDLPKGTAERWAHHTKNIKALPEHVKKRKKAAELQLAGLECLFELSQQEPSLKPAIVKMASAFGYGYSLPEALQQAFPGLQGPTLVKAAVLLAQNAIKRSEANFSPQGNLMPKVMKPQSVRHDPRQPMPKLAAA